MRAAASGLRYAAPDRQHLFTAHSLHEPGLSRTGPEGNPGGLWAHPLGDGAGHGGLRAPVHEGWSPAFPVSAGASARSQ